MRLLVIRLLGLGDVASLLRPAVKILAGHYPGATLDVLTFGVGAELMDLVPEVETVLAVGKDQWPDDLRAAIPQFAAIAEMVTQSGYDRIINLDTWFMPCFMARLLRDMGQPVEGNMLNRPVRAFLAAVNDGSLTQDYFSAPKVYLGSTYPRMGDWFTPWWEKPEHAGMAYPEFFLRHCCGYVGDVDFSLPIARDDEFRDQAGGRPVVALSFSGSRESKRYPRAEALKALLTEQGYWVWAQFDGSLPMQTTLGRLKASDALVCVATSTQWLARMVGCRSVMISGPWPPVVPGAEVTLPRHLDCQFCYQNDCPLHLPFPCLDVEPELVADHLRQLLSIA